MRIRWQDSSRRCPILSEDQGMYRIDLVGAEVGRKACLHSVRQYSVYVKLYSMGLPS